MRLKHFLSVFLTLLTLSVGQMWGAGDPTVTLPFEWTVATDNSSTVSLPSGVSENSIGRYNSNYPYRLQYNATGDYIQIHTDAAASEVKFTVKMIGGNTTSKFKVQGHTAATGTFSDIQEFTCSGSQNDVKTFTTTNSINSTYRYFRIYKSQHSNGGNVGLGYVKISKAATSYTITAQSNNTTYGTVSLSGSVITATPAANCRIASTAYNVTNGTATVVRGSGDDINKFTVTPTSNCTIRINFEQIPKHTLNYHDGSGDGSKTNVCEGTNLITALGTPAASCDETSTTFVGWTTTEIATKTDSKPTLVSADAVVNSTTAAAKYYAVYAKSNTGSWSITSIDKLNNSSGYAGYNGSHTASGISYTSSQVMAQSSTIQFQSSSGYMYNTTAVSADITSIVITSASANWSVYTSNSSISSTPSSGAISISSSGNTRTFTVSATGHKYFHIKGGSNTPQATNITVNYGTTKDYITTCCTKLGTINGSFFWTTHFCPVWPAKHRS